MSRRIGEAVTATGNSHIMLSAEQMMQVEGLGGSGSKTSNPISTAHGAKKATSGATEHVPTPAERSLQRK